jgi:hypothetical protein
MNKNLQEKVKNDLEKKGELKVLREKFERKIRETVKDLRAGNSKISKPSIPEFETKHGQICCALVKDFFEQFDMKMTIAVFMPEAHLDNVEENIDTLAAALQTESRKQRPLLFEIIERVFAQEQGSDEIETSINEDIEEDQSQVSRDDFFESVGSGIDQSANSLAIEKFDYIEPVRKVGGR